MTLRSDPTLRDLGFGLVTSPFHGHNRLCPFPCRSKLRDARYFVNSIEWLFIELDDLSRFFIILELLVERIVWTHVFLVLTVWFKRFSDGVHPRTGFGNLPIHLRTSTLPPLTSLTKRALIVPHDAQVHFFMSRPLVALSYLSLPSTHFVFFLSLTQYEFILYVTLRKPSPSPLHDMMTHHTVHAK